MAAPLLIWMFVQLPALLCARQSVSVMLIIEFTSAGMLFTSLLRNWRSCGAMILGAAVMLALATHRSGTPALHAIEAWIVLAMWLTLLTSVSRKTETNHRPHVVACANFLTLGGLLIAYLSSEFAGSASLSLFSPLVVALHLL